MVHPGQEELRMSWLQIIAIFCSGVAVGYLAAFITLWTISWIKMDKTDVAMRRAGDLRIDGDWVYPQEPNSPL
jgi:hypothetical protein